MSDWVFVPLIVKARFVMDSTRAARISNLGLSFLRRQTTSTLEDGEFNHYLWDVIFMDACSSDLMNVVRRAVFD